MFAAIKRDQCQWTTAMENETDAVRQSHKTDVALRSFTGGPCSGEDPVKPSLDPLGLLGASLAQRPLPTFGLRAENLLICRPE